MVISSDVRSLLYNSENVESRSCNILDFRTLRWHTIGEFQSCKIADAEQTRYPSPVFVLGWNTIQIRYVEDSATLGKSISIKECSGGFIGVEKTYVLIAIRW